MKIHQLRYFCAVARTGSFTRAAVEEGVTQPSLSQQIVKLEKTLGAKLFDRLSRAVQLTEYGRMLLPKAQTILREVNEARSVLQSLRRGVGGHLSVGCIPTLTPYFLAPRLSRFTTNFPQVELRLGVGKTHRLADRKEVHIPDLRGEKILLLKEGHCFRDDALKICSRARTPLSAMFETDQFASIFPLVAAGLGIALVPEMAARDAMDCLIVPLQPEARRRVGYIRVRRHEAGAAQTSFVKWMRKESGKI